MGQADHQVEVYLADLLKHVLLLQHVLRALRFEGQHFSNPLFFIAIKENVFFDALEIFLGDGS